MSSNSFSFCHSTSYPLADAVALNVNFAHGVGACPSYVRIVLLCTAPDAASGAAVGDEFECSGIIQGYQGMPVFCPFYNYSNAQNIFLFYSGDPANDCACAPCQFNSFTNFSLKVYWF